MSPAKNPALDHALSLAAQGIHVFPLLPNRKVPLSTLAAGGGWPEISTTDPKQIRAWAKSWPGCNFGVDCGKSGLFALDIDNKHGKDGSASLATLEAVHGKLPKSLTVATPSGGRHLYFKGQGKSTVGTLGDGLDTRSTGGYVVAPGSTIDGKAYQITDAAPIADAPAWFITAAGEVRARDPEAHVPACDLDLEHNVARAVRYLLEEAETALEGAGGDAATFRVACRVRDFGVSQVKALDLMLEHWNPVKAVPPWSLDDLAKKVANACRYAQDKAGNDTPDAMFPDSPGDEPAQSAPTGSRSLFVSCADLLKNPPKPRYLVNGFIEEETTTLWFGQPANLKSFLALDLGVAIASGQQWAGQDTKQGAVVLLCGEGHGGIARRLNACLKQRGLPPEAVPFHVARHAIDLSTRATVEHLTNTLTDLAPRLVIVDTLAANFGPADENSTQAMNAFLQNVTQLRGALRCAVLLIHHVGHGEKNRSRGASALEAGVDCVAKVSRDGLTVHLHEPSKLKDGEPWRDTWFRGEVVTVDLGDEMSPVTSVALTHAPGHHQTKIVKLGENQGFIIDTAEYGATEEELQEQFREWKGSEYKRQAFHRALKQLKDAGLLTRSSDGAWHSARLSTCKRGVNDPSTVDEG
jgi:hypothetical protein